MVDSSATMNAIANLHFSHPPVAKRFRPHYRLDSTSTEIYGAKNAHSVKHFPPYLKKTKFPEGKMRKDIGIFDFDGVFTDGSFWLYNHKFNFMRGSYRHDSRMKTLMPYVHARGHGDYALYNALGARNQAGLTHMQMRQQTLRFFDQVLMTPDFNQFPDERDHMVSAPFVHRGSIDLLLQRHREGKVNVIVSGSPRFAIQIFFENLHRYAHDFFGMTLPSEPLVDFIIGNMPVFDENATATNAAEKPLPIGDGKRLLVLKLLDTWGLTPTDISVFTDEIKADYPLLSLGNPKSHVAVNLLPEEEDLARQAGYSILRTDGRIHENRPARTLDFLHLYRKLLVTGFAVNSLSQCDDLPTFDEAV